MNKGHTVKVLDHGYVKLIDYMGSDEAVIEAARMSTDGGFVSWDPYVDHPRGDQGLLEYLYKHKHMTPFECGGEMMIEVQAPIMVFREWHRHRTQSYNEFSARYSKMPNLHYLPEPERIQTQSATNKQGSAQPVNYHYAEDFIGDLSEDQQEIYSHYDTYVSGGIAKEIARLNTPVSRYSKMRAKTDLRSWLGFLALRKDPAAQWEIRQYADVVSTMIQAIWPRTYALFEEYTMNSKSLSKTDLVNIQRILRSVEADGALDADDAVLAKKILGMI